MQDTIYKRKKKRAGRWNSHWNRGIALFVLAAPEMKTRRAICFSQEPVV
jgi:hypothetical protein